jgi:hypothetical protein
LNQGNNAYNLKIFIYDWYKIYLYIHAKLHYQKIFLNKIYIAKKYIYLSLNIILLEAMAEPQQGFRAAAVHPNIFYFFFRLYKYYDDTLITKHVDYSILASPIKRHVIFTPIKVLFDHIK